MSNGSKKLKQEPRMARHSRSPMLRALLTFFESTFGNIYFFVSEHQLGWGVGDLTEFVRQLTWQRRVRKNILIDYYKRKNTFRYHKRIFIAL
jgi:hypothetical protein